MIFVVLGTQKFQMNRLLKEIDALVVSKQIEEEVFAQIGNSDYLPQNYGYERFLSPNVFAEKIAECRILIAHSGVGTIMAGIKLKKPTIVYPRLEKYGEHVDDHQCEIAEAFSQQNYVLYCREQDSLVDLIQKCELHQFSDYISHKEDIISRIDDFIKSIF